MPKKSDYTMTHMPTRGKEHMAVKGTPSDGMGKMAGGLSNRRSHVPAQGGAHTAVKGTPVDGMAKMAKAGTQTRTPSMAKSHTKQEN